MAKRIFTSFAIEDEKLRDLFIGQARNEKVPYELVDMSVKQPWSSEWKTKCRTKIKGCDVTREFIFVDRATDEDYHTEYLANILNIKVVEGMNEAIAHIANYGSGHSEAIVTENYSAAEMFMNVVDAACVYVNASTRFTDGGAFGFGAEVGISTNKLHARGPMGINELTTYKFKLYGNGQIRQ